MSTTSRYSVLLIVLAAFLWSLDAVLRRELYALPPITIVFLEHVIGLLLLLPFVLKSIPQIRSIQPRAWGALVWVAFLSGLVGTLLFTAALLKVNFIPFSAVILLQKLQPFFAILAAGLLLRERVSWKFIGWTILAFVAGYFVSFPELSISWQNNREEIIAALFALGAAAAWGSSTAVSRYGLLRIPSTLMTALRFALTIVFAIPFLFLLKDGAASLSVVSSTQWIMLLVIALSSGMVALLIYYRGLRNVPARVSTIAELVFPISAIFIDYFYFGGGLTVTQWIGAVALLLIIYRVSTTEREVQSEKNP